MPKNLQSFVETILEMLKIVILVLAVTAAVIAQDGCPRIFPRSSWSSRPAGFIPVLPIRPARFVVFHPTGRGPCPSLAECSPVMREFQTFHMDANSWPDISWHFLMGSSPNYDVFEGRGWGRIGVNVEGFSNQAINVAFIGG